VTTTHLPPGNLAPEAIQRFRAGHDALLAELERAIQGKTDVLRLALACLFAGGHLLIEDVPGTGKTTLAKAMAGSVAGVWHRIQFTPDLLPGDITGVPIWDQRAQQFQFRPGPVFGNVVLADEINRASPKTQSALLEVMEEGQVTADGVTHPVPQPFMVVATQNPIDLEGTYQLPEAQLDRFLMRISLGHPDLEVETAILTSRAAAEPPPVTAVASLDQVRWMRQAAAGVHVAPQLAQYVAAVALATREHPALRLGVSTRGSLALVRAAQAYAAAAGRHYAVPDDIRALARPVLAHRLVLTGHAEIRGSSTGEVLDEVLGTVPVPGLGERR
jgi:MoxR-like ATPase